MGRQRGGRGAEWAGPPQSLRRMPSTRRLPRCRRNARTLRRRDTNRSSGSGRVSRRHTSDCTIAATARSSRWRSAVLMPGGATGDRQFSISTSTPCSRKRRGRSARKRLALEMPRTRTVPASIWAQTHQAVEPADTCPPRTADRNSPRRERDVVHTPRTPLRHRRRVRPGSGRSGPRTLRPTRRLGPFPERADEIVQRSERQRIRNDDDFVFAVQPRDGGDFAQRHRRSCVTIAQSMINPDTSRRRRPRARTMNRARPIVPAAPAMFSTEEV